MKFFLLIGGFLGFSLAYMASWNAGNAPAGALRDAAIGCLAGATLFRCLHLALLSTLRAHVLAQVAIAQAEVKPGNAPR